MKVHVNAVIFKHFKKVLLSISIFYCIHSFSLSHTIVMQFRAPLSLSELLHEGLLVVQSDLERVNVEKEEETQDFLNASLQKIENLQNLYDAMNTKSGLNGIHADERDFLQGLIDRIDQMIHQLEGNSVDSNSDLVRRNIHMLHVLRTTLED